MNDGALFAHQPAFVADDVHVVIVQFGQAIQHDPILSAVDGFPYDSLLPGEIAGFFIFEKRTGKGCLIARCPLRCEAFSRSYPRLWS